jgi:hypothetical protein
MAAATEGAVTITTNWLLYRAAIVAAIEAAQPTAVLAECAVAWEDGPRPHAKHRLLLSIVSATFDDRDSALDTGGAQLLESMAVIVVQVRAESAHDSGDLDALWLIEQCRLGLRKVSVKEALAAAGILITVFPRSTRNVGGIADDHALSVHALEFTTCCTFTLVPPDEDAGLIERITIEGTVEDDAGLDIDIEIDVSDPDPEPP